MYFVMHGVSFFAKISAYNPPPRDTAVKFYVTSVPQHRVSISYSREWRGYRRRHLALFPVPGAKSMAARVDWLQLDLSCTRWCHIYVWSMLMNAVLDFDWLCSPVLIPCCWCFRCRLVMLFVLPCFGWRRFFVPTADGVFLCPPWRPWWIWCYRCFRSMVDFDALLLICCCFFCFLVHRWLWRWITSPTRARSKNCGPSSKGDQSAITVRCQPWTWDAIIWLLSLVLGTYQNDIINVILYFTSINDAIRYCNEFGLEYVPPVDSTLLQYRAATTKTSKRRKAGYFFSQENKKLGSRHDRLMLILIIVSKVSESPK